MTRLAADISCREPSVRRVHRGASCGLPFLLLLAVFLLAASVPSPAAKFAGSASAGTPVSISAGDRVITNSAPQPVLQAVRSRKTHGAAGDFALVIDTLQLISGAPTVEPRAIGAGHVIVFEYDSAITSTGTLTAINGAGMPLPSATAIAVGNTVVVTLPNVPDGSRARVSLTGVNGGAPTVSASVGFLLADVDESRLVNAADGPPVRARSGQATDSANFRFDLNASGAVSAADIAAVKARTGAVLPNQVAWSMLTTGGNHTCGKTGGTTTYCWGYDNQGQLGDSSFTLEKFPVVVSGGLNFTTVVAGGSHTCGLTSNGAAYCWGDNTYGQLGIASTDSLSQEPAAVAGGIVFASLTAGGSSTCGLTSAGVAYCWGANFGGELGDGTSTLRRSPVLVMGGLLFDSLSAGLIKHTCGLVGGVAYCWGWNGYGQIGISTGGDHTSPKLVSGGLTFASIVAGGQHTCARTSAGVAYCWGDYSFGQLGNGVDSMTPSPPDSTTPLLVLGGNAFASLTAGNGHTCGVTASGNAFCWGYNLDGRVGDASNTSRSIPAAVAGGIEMSGVFAGSGHSCGLTSTSAAICWGFNGQGQLGNGSITNRNTPLAVSGP
ncbi:MAG: hypothetical protein ABI905_01820 [Betaproteobacteria bacterium]